MTLTKEQLGVHVTHITASQVPTIMGLNDFETRTNLMQRKLRPDDYSSEGSRAADRGHALEEPVALFCAEELGVDKERIYHAADFYEMMANEGHLDRSFFQDSTLFSRRAPGKYGSSSDFIIVLDPDDPANPDNEIINYEIKTSTSGAWSGGKTPHKVKIQTQWQMAMLRSHGFNVVKTYIGALIQGRDTVRVVEFDDKLLMEAVVAVGQFLKELEEHELNGTFPSMDDDPHRRQRHVIRADEVPESDALDLIKIVERMDEARLTKDEERAAKEHGIALLQRLGVDSIRGDGWEVAIEGGGVSTRTNQSRLIGKLAAKLRILGHGDFVDAMQKDCEFTVTRKPYLKIKEIK